MFQTTPLLCCKRPVGSRAEAGTSKEVLAWSRQLVPGPHKAVGEDR